MSHMVLPDVGEIPGVIADYLDAFMPDLKGRVEREQIISNCVPPFTSIVCALETLDASDATHEKRLFWQFLRDLSGMRQRVEGDAAIRLACGDAI